MARGYRTHPDQLTFDDLDYLKDNGSSPSASAVEERPIVCAPVGKLMLRDIDDLPYSVVKELVRKGIRTLTDLAPHVEKYTTVIGGLRGQIYLAIESLTHLDGDICYRASVALMRTLQPDTMAANNKE